MTLRMKLAAASLGTLAMLGTGVAYAQAQNDRAPTTRAAVQERATSAFARMDANSDGVVNEADRAARAEARFDRLDTDGNGSISRAEFAAMHEARGERRAERGGERGQHRKGMRRGMRGGMMTGVDTNGDGAISQAELTASMLVRFDAADADRDGTISAAERQAQRQQMRQNRQERRAARTPATGS